MKKLLLSAVALMALVSSYAGGNGVVGHDEPVQGGFFLNIPFAYYGGNFMSPTDVKTSDIPDESKISMIGYGLEIGNMFQLTDLGSGGDMGLGIRAMWFGFGLASGSNDFGKQSFVNFQLLSPGIYFSKAIGDNAIDTYINYVPTLAGSTYTDKESGEAYSASLAFGSPLEFGVAFRTGVFMAGLEYNFGKVAQGEFEVDGDEEIEAEDLASYGRWGHLRLQIGFKF